MTCLLQVNHPYVVEGCAMPYPLQVNHRYVWDLFVDGALGDFKHTPSGLPSTPGDVLGLATRLPDMRFNDSQVFQVRAVGSRQKSTRFHNRQDTM